MIVLAQYEAARLVTGAPEPALSIDWPIWINATAAVAVCFLLLALWRARERRITNDPLGHAFARLARRANLPRHQRARVVRLAAERGVAPIGILLAGMIVPDAGPPPPDRSHATA